LSALQWEYHLTDIDRDRIRHLARAERCQARLHRKTINSRRVLALRARYGRDSLPSRSELDLKGSVK